MSHDIRIETDTNRRTIFRDVYFMFTAPKTDHSAPASAPLPFPHHVRVILTQLFTSASTVHTLNAISEIDAPLNSSNLGTLLAGHKKKVDPISLLTYLLS